MHDFQIQNKWGGDNIKTKDLAATHKLKRRTRERALLCIQYTLTIYLRLCMFALFHHSPNLMFDVA